MTTAVSFQATFQFRCLGPVSLTGRDGEDLGLRTRKLIALLLLIARQRGKPVSREVLIELLWSEDSEKKARHSLSQSVSLINKALGVEAIAAADRDRLVIRPDLVWLDVTDFERMAGNGDQAEARRLWRGALLEGIWVQRAPNFERWLADERQRLERALRRIAHGLIEERRAEGDYGAMRAEAESLLELDALDEKAMLACLEALQLAGDRTVALRRYGEFERRLKEELDAEPGSALRGWARRNRKGDSGAESRYVPIPRVSEVTVLPAPEPIFGRTEEYALLWNAWEQATAGKGAFIVLEGEAGIGKTALATKLANQVHVAGGSVCFVRCYRTEKSVPFAPVTALIRQLSRLPGFVALDPVWIGELTRLVPELRERYPNAPQPMAVDDAARHRLADAAVQAAQVVADEQALLIVVDDLQDADEATLAALHYLGRQTPGLPVVVTGACRAASRGSQLEQAFFESARSAGFGRFVKLDRLDDSQVERVVLHVLARKGQEAVVDLVKELVHRARGNPLQAVEAALAACDAPRKRLHEAKAVPTTTTGVFDESAADRLRRLPIPSGMIALTIATAGRPLSEYEIAQATELKPGELAAGLSALENTRFLRRDGTALGFAHERYANVAYEFASLAERRAVHDRLARMLARSAASNPAGRYEAARHYAAAGLRQQAKAQALHAARYARSLGAVRERSSALELAMRMSSRLDGRVAVEQGECLLELREYERLDALCKDASRILLARAGIAADFEYLRAAIDLHLGRTTLPEIKDRLRGLTEQGKAFALESAARTMLMRVAYRSGDHAVARRTARSLRKSLQASGPDWIGHVYQASAYLAAKYYWPRRAFPLLRLALSAAQESHDLELEHLCRCGLGAVERQSANYTRSIAELELALVLARRQLNPQLEASDLGDIAVAEMSRGRFDRSRELFDSAMEIVERHTDRMVSIFTLANRGELDLMAESIPNAEQGFRAALDQSLSLRELPMALQALSGLAMCAQRSGNLELLSRWTREIAMVGGGAERLFHDRWMTEASLAWDTALNQGDAETAVSQLDLAAKELRRRDLDHSLLVQLERLRILRACFGKADASDVRSVQHEASQYGAGAVLKGLVAL